jgi:hypothetical protein
MKTKITIYLLLMSAIVISCGKTDEDIQMEEDILGVWQAFDANGDAERNIPIYTFMEENEGTTSLGDKTDEMHWEIKRAQLKVYYDKSPDYVIGYDKYNSRSLFQIHSLVDDYLELTMYYNDGFQADLDFYRQ